MSHDDPEAYANWLEHVACDAEEARTVMAAVSQSHPLPAFLQGVEWALIYAAEQARTIESEHTRTIE